MYKLSEFAQVLAKNTYFVLSSDVYYILLLLSV